MALKSQQKGQYMYSGKGLVYFCADNFALKALDTIGTYNCLLKNLLGNEQWRAVDSIEHSEKQLPLK